MCICTALTPLSAEAAPTAEETVEARDYTAAEKAATDLKSLGLFKGVSDTDFDLDRAPTRVEALVMLIRLLGQEKTALEGEFKHPFTDVPSWADKYIGYAYDSKLTNGISATEFGTSDASAAMYLTFVLRALDYSDAEGADFTWDAPFELAEKIGILTDEVNTEEFFRADVALVSFNALGAKIKDSELTLADVLILLNVFTTDQYAAVNVEPTPEYSYITDFTDYDPGNGLDETGFYAGIKALDYVTLPDYKNYPGLTEYLTVTEEDINAQIEMILSEYEGEVEMITDRAVAEGDKINADMVLTVNGQRIELDEFKGVDLDIASEPTEEELGVVASMLGAITDDIDDILDEMVAFDVEYVKKIIGSFPGEVIKGTFVYPEIEEYPDLGGMTLEIEIKINYIHGAAVEIELNDEIAMDYGFETVDALLEDIKVWILEEKEQEMVALILDGAKVSELPKAAIEYELNQTLYAVVDTLTSYGYDMTLEEIAQMAGKESLDEYILEIVDTVKESVREQFVYRAVAEAEGLTVTDEYIAEIGVTEAVEEYGKPFVIKALLQEVVTEYIVSLCS